VFANLIHILAPGALNIDSCGKGSHGEDYFATIFNARLTAELNTLKEHEICILLCSANAIKRTTGVRKQREQNRMAYLASHFWSRFTSFERVWRKRCSAATDPSGSDQGPGERVGRGVILLELPLNHLLSPEGWWDLFPLPVVAAVLGCVGLHGLGKWVAVRGGNDFVERQV